MRKFLAQSWLVLLLGTGFSVALAGAQAGFGPRIRENERQALESAVYEVVPDAARFEEIDVSGRKVFKCVKESGDLCGWAVPASGFGFQDEIRLVVGLSPDGNTVTGIKVLLQKETPGLGNKIEEQEWRDQFVGLDASRPGTMLKSEPKDKAHEVQAVTGATITSVSVMSIVNGVLADVRPRLPNAKPSPNGAAAQER